MKKAFLSFLLTVVLFFVFVVKTFASDERFVTVAYPVRGKDFWEGDYSPLQPVVEQKKAVEERGFAATWLLRPDVFLNAELSGFFNDNFSEHELGIFFEITPLLSEKARVDYPTGEKSDANRFFLSGYSVEKRKVLIDTAFENFKEAYGYYPKSVGAWHIDATSVNYMREKYGVAAVMLVADQYATDRYRVWGAWWGVPYYPSRNHILVPAATSKDKLDVVITQWAQRDPVNGYGSGKESIYSLQANDYVQVGLGIEYFEKILNSYLFPEKGDFGHVTLGIENELFLGSSEEFEKQLDLVKKLEVTNITMSDFSNWYRHNYRDTSPEHTISAKDPLRSNKEASWIMTKDYRAGILKSEEGTFVRDLRVYKDSKPEPFLLSANNFPELRVETKAVVDTVKDPESGVEMVSSIEELVKSYSVQKKFSWWIIFLGLFFLLFILMLKEFFKLLKLRSELLIFLTGTLTLSLTMVKSGLLYKFGMGFWGPNGHDGVWHIALINSLSRGGFGLPVFSGFDIMNYHIGYDLFLAFIHKLSAIPAQTLYFQLLPPFLAALIGYLTYKFVYTWRSSRKEALWSMFFIYYGSGWGYLVTLLRDGAVGGESTFWSQQAISTLINPPFAMSLVLILLGLIMLLNYKKTSKTQDLIFASLCFGVLMQVKVYGALLCLGGLFVAGVWEYLRQKKAPTFKVFILSLLISLVVFLPTKSTPGDIVVFRPFWFLETMMGLTDRLGWERFYSAMTNYRLGDEWIKAVGAYGVAFGIFILGNIGTRVVVVPLFWKWLKNIRKVTSMEVFLLGVISAGVLIPTLFLQKGTPWNTIQFMYYSLAFLGILAGISFASLFKKRSALATSLVVLLTIPTTFGTLAHYLPARPPAAIPYAELEALEFLKNQEDGVVLTYPYDAAKAKEAASNPPRPLYLYESTAYVAAFGEKPVYLEDEVNLSIMGYEWEDRREVVEEFLDTLSEEEAREFLEEADVKYVYWLRSQRAKLGDMQLGLKKIFENSEVTIFKVE